VKTIKNESLEDIEENTTYTYCAFYLNEKKQYSAKNCKFIDCSFRSNIALDNIENCTFTNCGFSSNFEIFLHELTEFPKNILQFRSLTYLCSTNNEFTEIPKEISQLQNLTELYLSGNKLTEIPKEIGQLQNLTYLNLDWNRLTELPKEIGQLQNLTKISFYDYHFLKRPFRKELQEWLPNCQIRCIK